MSHSEINAELLEALKVFVGAWRFVDFVRYVDEFEHPSIGECVMQAQAVIKKVESVKATMKEARRG